MKKWIIVFVLAVAAGTFWVKSRPASAPPASDRDQNVANRAPAQPSGLGKYLKAPRVGYREVFLKDTRIPKDCLDYFDSLQKIDFFSGAENELTYQMLPHKPEGCSGEFIKGFSAAEQEYLKKCTPKDQNLSEKISEECSSAVYMLRSGVTRLALQDKPLSEITDMAQLADLVFSEFAGIFNKDDQTPDFARMRAISDRMMELNPNLFAAQKVSAISNLMEGFMAPKGSDNSGSWDRAEQVITKALESHPNDETMQDAKIAADTKGFDPVLTRELSQKMTNDNPESDRGWYLMSYAEWKQGDHGNSIINLKKAIALAPDNEDYQKTLSEISKSNANQDSFKGAFKVGISNGDFND